MRLSWSTSPWISSRASWSFHWATATERSRSGVRQDGATAIHSNEYLEDGVQILTVYFVVGDEVFGPNYMEQPIQRLVSLVYLLLWQFAVQPLTHGRAGIFHSEYVGYGKPARILGRISISSSVRNSKQYLGVSSLSSSAVGADPCRAAASGNASGLFRHSRGPLPCHAPSQPDVQRRQALLSVEYGRQLPVRQRAKLRAVGVVPLVVVGDEVVKLDLPLFSAPTCQYRNVPKDSPALGCRTGGRSARGATRIRAGWQGAPSHGDALARGSSRWCDRFGTQAISVLVRLRRGSKPSDANGSVKQTRSHGRTSRTHSTRRTEASGRLRLVARIGKIACRSGYWGSSGVVEEVWSLSGTLSV